MPRTLRPAPPDAAAHLERVILSLKAARYFAAKAECPATLRKIRSALKSAEGAKRHLARRRALAPAAPVRRHPTHDAARPAILCTLLCPAPVSPTAGLPFLATGAARNQRPIGKAPDDRRASACPNFVTSS